MALLRFSIRADYYGAGGAPAPGWPQVAFSLRQMVVSVATPGATGVKVVVPVRAVGATVPVQARSAGVGTVMPGVDRAATAEFMYALASAWQAPAAERTR